mmetsp:Transcript_34191/g.39615  ORF Transcript_34191/g.39615 Transcript_34191/m.39615 type:complete len:122 (-) Transcript_34191:385-750(-)
MAFFNYVNHSNLLMSRILASSATKSAAKKHFTCGVIRKSSPITFPMKSGTPLRGLDVMVGQDPPTSKAREEYPPWINDLVEPLTSLAALRQMKFEDATDNDKMRYLKLTRRKQIKEQNEDA